MKFAYKAFGILVLGVLSTAVVYPVLHETGHCIMAIITGAKITQIGLFPLPYVACEMQSGNNVCQMVTGMGGLLFPVALSTLLKPRIFWLWYVVFAIKLTNVYALIYSMISVFLYTRGIAVSKDDIAQLLMMFPEKILYILIAIFAVLALEIVIIFKEKPLLKCMVFFEKCGKKTGANA